MPKKPVNKRKEFITYHHLMQLPLALLHGLEGINDLDSYDLSFSFYHVLFSI
jgi:hypothetical protein